MDQEHVPETDLIELLAELGLEAHRAPGAGETLFLQQNVPDLARIDLDARQASIVEESKRWIGFLEDQSERLTSIASGLYDRLNASVAHDVTARAALKDGQRAAVVDRLEWTLASLECWIEEQQPTDLQARFLIRWTDTDGMASWVGPDGEPLSQAASLYEIVQDSVATEGEFPPVLASAVARLTVEGLRTGEFDLLRTRRVQGESREGQSIFELIPRGDAFKEAMAAGQEPPALVPPEAEVVIDEALPIAAFLDQASYAADATDRTAIGGDAELARAISRVAEGCHVPSGTMLRCLFALTREQLESAARARHYEEIIRLVSAVTRLVTLISQERGK
jgi:hypothetical protein